MRHDIVKKAEPSMPTAEGTSSGTVTSGTRDLARAAVSGVQKKLEDMKSAGIHAGRAEDLIRQASVVFSAGDFPLSRDLATKADAQLRDTMQLHDRSQKLLEDIRRTHPTLISAGALAPEKSDAAERSRRAFESGDYILAVEQGEKALAPGHLASATVPGHTGTQAAAGPPDGYSTSTPGVGGHPEKHLCPVCNRVFAIPLATSAAPRVTCPWCGASVQVR
jgi:hypothetical protein